ncbi:hypothetical protein [Vitreimonas flagellata]|uniref:hypothetical protein n=1 Tax=Vitreimonas flagellata TaxID=2560861 RepID=UPI001074ED01|nr:hypothetical protein [Vitreimonas flagellata]
MKHIPATPLTTHRCARLVAWGRLMLVWLSAVMFADRRGSRRHMRARYPMCDSNRFARYIGNFILVRALADKPHLRASGLLQQDPRPGLHTKARPQRALRAARGSVLRKCLRHRDLRTRFGIFMYALDNLDALARVLSPQLARRLTRLQPILMRPRAADALRTLTTPEVLSADSS